MQPVVDNLNDDTPISIDEKRKKKPGALFHSLGYSRVAATYYYVVWMNHERDEINIK